jgi:hypothetical protein
MAKSSWTHLKDEKRVGEYEELTLQMGHWWIQDDPQWPAELRDGYHMYSETGVAMIEPTRLVIRDALAYRDRNKLTYRSYILRQDNEEKKLDAIVEGAKARNSFARVSAPDAIVHKYIPALRHFFWGTGMMQIYGSAYTPSSTVMNTLLFQVFDSMRHAQRLVELSWERGPSIHATSGSTGGRCSRCADSSKTACRPSTGAKPSSPSTSSSIPSSIPFTTS